MDASKRAMKAMMGSGVFDVRGVRIEANSPK
jgi:hypothetical protein